MRLVTRVLTILTVCVFAIFAILLLGCAAKNIHDTIAGTHDSLETAMNLEAQLCWGVKTVRDPVVDRTHCTTSVAAAIKLTDARHKAINARIADALDVHRTLTAQAAAGGTIDTARLQTIINDILALIVQLTSTPAVGQMATAVKAGGTIR